MTILNMQNLNLYAFEQNPVDDVQALFQTPKHWRYKGVKPSLTLLSLRSRSFFYVQKKTLNFEPRGRVVFS